MNWLRNMLYGNIQQPQYSHIFEIRFINGEEALLRLQYIPTGHREGTFKLPKKYDSLEIDAILSIDGVRVDSCKVDDDCSN